MKKKANSINRHGLEITGRCFSICRRPSAGRNRAPPFAECEISAGFIVAVFFFRPEIESFFRFCAFRVGFELCGREVFDNLAAFGRN